jgi:NAD(P)H dehydrogenase (quinone)
VNEIVMVPQRSENHQCLEGPTFSTMRVLILYANPVESSFGAALHRQVVDVLGQNGHLVDDCDLYAEAFDPILSKRDRLNYHDTSTNRLGVSNYVERLLATEALVLVYPVWNEGFPAILKGFIDRVFLPGVCFKTLSDGSSAPNLGNLKKLAAVCTYGAGRLGTFVMSDPPRRVVKRLLRAMPTHHVSCQYLAHYDMNHSTPRQRAAFLAKVKRAFARW